ncbi:MAG: DUF4145 domain-containing protein [Candidatus Kaiserbacteria bacterium]|nr:DUF4145 domain-containing protein [Candidatus Kaiserbacteria bacterium]
MKCPHCLHAIKPNVETISVVPNYHNNSWDAKAYVCPNCERPVIILSQQVYRYNNWVISDEHYVFPKAISSQPLPEEVTDVVVVSDYNEAGLVLADSPKSSAALTRRCLQYILREKVGTKSRDLADQIQEVIDEKILPTEITEGLDAVRNIGNFAAHPQKSISTGEIVEVDPHEAEWNLEILFDLIDYVYVRPIRFQQKKENFNVKLSEVGKPEI